MDSIDRLATLIKGDDGDDAYMLGYRDARAGKPPKPSAPGGEPDHGDEEAVAGGEDRDGDGDSDEPGTDVDGDGAEPEEQSDQDGDGANDASAMGGDDEETDDASAGDPNVEGDEGADAAAADERDGNPDDEAQPQDGDGEDIDLPEDDGENHGAGDLNEDGQAQSLLQEVASVERDYYAAAGMHGAGHHKTVKALDIYHRVVRKLVRALMGEGEDIDGDGAPEGHPDDAEGEEGEGANGNGKSDGKKPPPFGAKAKDKGGDSKKPPFGGAKSDDKSSDGESKKPPFGGDKSKDDSDDQGDDSDSGDDEKKSKKKPPPFGKSFDAFDRIALMSDDPRAMLDVLEKGGVFSRVNGKLVKGGPGSRGGKVVGRSKSGKPVYASEGERRSAAAERSSKRAHKSGSINDHFGAAATHRAAAAYNKADGNHQAAAHHEAQAAAHEKHINDTKKSMQKKHGQPQLQYRDMVKSDPLAIGAEGVKVVHQEHNQVYIIDDRGGPMLLKSAGQRFVSRDTPIAITVNAACPIHGHNHESIYKSQLLNHGQLPCTCKR